MKNKILIYIGCVFSLGLFCIGCEENKMEAFNQPQGINFARINTDNLIDFTNDDVSALSVTYDFTNLFENAIPVYDVLAKIQGYASDRDLKIVLKVEAEEGAPTPSIELDSAGYAVVAGDLLDTLFFQVKRPLLRDTLYQAKLVFDYVHSDVARGTEERQVFRVTVVDNFDMSWGKLGITQADWDTYIQPYIGSPAPMKIRLILKENGAMRTFLSNMKKWPSIYANIMNIALQEYNTQHPDSPLCEADGTLVVYAPES